MKLEDMAECALHRMIVHLKGKKQCACTGDSFKKTEDEMPPKWFLTVFHMFLLFGRRMKGPWLSGVLAKGDPKKLQRTLPKTIIVLPSLTTVLLSNIQDRLCHRKLEKVVDP